MIKPYTLAIDIGGSKLVTALVSREGRVLAKRRAAWPALDAQTVIDTIIRESQTLLETLSGYTPSLIGATIPGLADPRQGLWIESTFSRISHLPLTQALSDVFSIPAYADNDGQACALAEKLYGSCRENTDFLYITVSNGIGGALFLNDRLYCGAYGKAGEIGHSVAVEHGRRCACGKHGCLEMHAAGPGLALNYRELGGRPAPDGSPAQGELIAKRAAEGEAAALEAFRMEGVYLGRALAFACNLLNPGKVIIGGGLSLAYALYAGALEATLREGLYQSANQSLTIEPTALGYDGGLLGAAAVAYCRAEHLYHYCQ
jgi:glucokinase